MTVWAKAEEFFLEGLFLSAYLPYHSFFRAKSLIQRWRTGSFIFHLHQFPIFSSGNFILWYFAMLLQIRTIILSQSFYCKAYCSAAWFRCPFWMSEIIILFVSLLEQSLSFSNALNPPHGWWLRLVRCIKSCICKDKKKITYFYLLSYHLNKRCLL